MTSSFVSRMSRFSGLLGVSLLVAGVQAASTRVSVSSHPALPLTGLNKLAAQPAQSSNESLEPTFLRQHCFSCHNSRLRTAGLALDTLDLNHVAQEPDVWEK